VFFLLRREKLKQKMVRNVDIGHLFNYFLTNSKIGEFLLEKATHVFFKEGHSH